MGHVRPLSVVLLIALLSGCAGSPLAEDTQPSRPSERLQRAESTNATADLQVFGTAVGGTGRICMFVGRDSDSPDAIETGHIRLDWTPQAGQTLEVVASGARTARTEGSSPLVLGWTAADGPSALPFRVEVGLTGTSYSLGQALRFFVEVAPAMPGLEVLEGPC